MKAVFIRTALFAAVFFWGFQSLSAQTEVSPPPQKITPPIFLKPDDKTPPGGLASPAVPDQGPDRGPLSVEESIDAPQASLMAQLSDPDFFELLKETKKDETQINQVNWHVSDDIDLDYCHVRDEQGNNWYGWSDGQAFHWILMTGNRFWWYDEFAGHWLYYAKNYWWRADAQSASRLQVLIGGEYYLCQKNGAILKDMGQDGSGEILSGNGPFRGDFHHGGHGGGHAAGGSGSRSNSSGSSSNP